MLHTDGIQKNEKKIHMMKMNNMNFCKRMMIYVRKIIFNFTWKKFIASKRLWKWNITKRHCRKKNTGTVENINCTPMKFQKNEKNIHTMKMNYFKTFTKLSIPMMFYLRENILNFIWKDYVESNNLFQHN